jgi:hypothetical protein
VGADELELGVRDEVVIVEDDGAAADDVVIIEVLSVSGVALVIGVGLLPKELANNTVVSMSNTWSRISVEH